MSLVGTEPIYCLYKPWITFNVHFFLWQVVVDYDPAEYAEFLKEREEVVEKELQELLEIREAKILRK